MFSCKFAVEARFGSGVVVPDCFHEYFLWDFIDSVYEVVEGSFVFISDFEGTGKFACCKSNSFGCTVDFVRSFSYFLPIKIQLCT